MINFFQIVWQFLGRYKKAVFFVMGVGLFAATIEAFIPYLYGYLIDVAIKEKELILISKFLLLWLILRLVANQGHRLVRRKGGFIAVDASHDLLLKLTGHILDLPLSFHKDRKIGAIFRKIDRASDYLERTIAYVIFSFLPDFLSLLMALAILFWIKWELGLAMILILLVYGYISWQKNKPILKTHKTLHRTFEKVYGNLYDTMSNIQIVKSHTTEDIERERHGDGFRGQAAKVYKNFLRLHANLNFWQQTVSSLGFIFVLSLGIFFLRNELISIGQLIMFLGYVNLASRPFSMLAEYYRIVSEGIIVINRGLKLLKVEPEKYQIETSVNLRELKGEIEFQDVSFGYQDHQRVLNKINFKVRAGEIVALVGESGVGKTTLVDLISRYYSPNEGKILIDGYNIEEVNLKSLREKIALVPQEISLFNDTIENNIRYGRPGASSQEIIKASQIANADEFIQRFSKKYQQVVGERGIKLSTGQKQRIAIARAVLRNPIILILDEATSNLDSISERLVQSALAELIKGRTVFIIAHRLSTVMRADKIIVLDKGQVAEIGNHYELLARKNFYYRLFTFQTDFLA